MATIEKMMAPIEPDGVGDAVPKSKKPKAGCGKKEPKRAAPKRCQKDSAGDRGTACKKTKS